MTTINPNQGGAIPASATQETAAAANSAVAKSKATIKTTSDQFLTMLVTQIKNQDPLNPMDNNAMTTQLAQISTVNGINDLNTTLQSLVGQTDISQSLQASALIGKTVLVAGNSIKLGSGTPTNSAVELSGAAETVTVTISSSSGQTVRTIKSGAQQAGIVNTGWDGRDDNGKVVPDGAYTLSVKAVDAAGNVVPATPLMSGTVNSVAYSPQGPRVDLGTTGTAAVSDIKKVT